MAEEDQASKTEKPTGKKLTQAKRKGQVAQSQEVKNWAILLAGSVGLVMFMPTIMNNVRMTNLKFIQTAHAIPVDLKHLRFLLYDMLVDLAAILAPLIGLLVAAALAVTLAQVGWTPSVEKMKPDVKKFSLMNGVKKIVGTRALVEFVKSIAKMATVGSVALVLVTPLLVDLELLPSFEIIQTLDRLHTVAIHLAFGTVAVMTIIAVLDYMYQKYDHIKKLMMTKQEVKDEHKQSDGDPKVKQRLAKIRMERAQLRMMAAVPHAHVVITNPTHYAVALEYDMDTMPAPKLTAKGVDELALRIREVADENDVPIVENPPLARALYAAVEIDEDIPPEHYHAVAEVIGYVFRLKGKLQTLAAPGPGVPPGSGAGDGEGPDDDDFGAGEGPDDDDPGAVAALH